MNDHPIELHLDSGAEVNVINEETFAQIGRPKLQKTQVKAKLYDGTLRPFIGKAIGTFIFGDKKVEHDYYVVRQGSLNLLSFKTMNEFGFLDGLKRKIDQCTVENEELMTKESLNFDKNESIKSKGKPAKTLMTTSLHMKAKSDKEKFIINRPSKKVFINYIGHHFGKEYMTVVDAFSKYPEVLELPNRSSAETI